MFFVFPTILLWGHMREHGSSEGIFANGKTASTLDLVTGGLRGTHSLSHWFPSVLQLAKYNVSLQNMRSP